MTVFFFHSRTCSSDLLLKRYLVQGYYYACLTGNIHIDPVDNTYHSLQDTDTDTILHPEL